LLIGCFVGLLSLVLLAGSIYLLYLAERQTIRYDLVRRANFATHPERGPEIVSVRRRLTLAEAGRDRKLIALLLAGCCLLLFTFAGRHLVKFAFPVGSDEPTAMRTGTVQEIATSDGAKIHIETYGPPDAPTLILTHGWGTNSTEWYYAKRHLADRFRLIVWDEPGLGESSEPRDRDYALERLAADLHSVLSVADGRRVVLVGHSIGGMINLTFCRLYPQLIGTQVAGIVQLDTSYTNPVKTTKGSDFSLAIQKPVGEPILHAMIFLSPLVRVINWLNYQDGLAYVENAQSSFAGSETRGHVDLVSRYQVEASPAVVARGTLAMFHWDTTPVLKQIEAPVLIAVGQEDTTTLPRASEFMQGTIPHAAIQVVSPSAHYGLLEQNYTYDAAIAKFASACLIRQN
jgi:pimeloyl-ACP methyl ester carboxylesterase